MLKIRESYATLVAIMTCVDFIHVLTTFTIYIYMPRVKLKKNRIRW